VVCFHFLTYYVTRDIAVGIVTGYGLDDKEVRVLVPVGAFRVVHTGSGAHPAFYPMSTGGSFPGVKAAGA
jgi:hypothetical protein